MVMTCLWPCTHSDHSYLQGDVFKSSASTTHPKHLHDFEDFSSMPSLFCLWQMKGFSDKGILHVEGAEALDWAAQRS